MMIGSSVLCRLDGNRWLLHLLCHRDATSPYSLLMRVQGQPSFKSQTSAVLRPEWWELGLFLGREILCGSFQKRWSFFKTKFKLWDGTTLSSAQLPRHLLCFANVEENRWFPSTPTLASLCSCCEQVWEVKQRKERLFSTFPMSSHRWDREWAFAPCFSLLLITLIWFTVVFLETE